MPILWWTLRKLRSKDVFVRRRAVDELAGQRDPRSVQPLLAYLRNLPPETYESNEPAGQVVKLLASKEMFVDTAIFHELLSHPLASVVEQAITPIRQQKNSQSVPLLVNLLMHRNEDVRKAAADALEYSFEWQPATDEERAALLVAQRNFEKLPRPSALDVGFFYLKNWTDGVAAAAVTPLIVALTGYGSDGESWRCRSAAANALGAIGDRRAIPELRKALDDSNVHVRTAAGDALSRIGDPATADRLVQVLWSTRDLYLLENTVQSLTKMREPRVFEWAMRHIEGESRSKAIALRVLGNFGHSRTADIALPILKSFSAPADLWGAAVSAVATVHDARVIPVLLDAFAFYKRKSRNDEMYLRADSAARALEGLGDGCTELGLPLCGRAPFMRAKLAEIQEMLTKNAAAVPPRAREKLARLQRVWEIRQDNDFSDDPDRTYEIVAIDEVDCVEVRRLATRASA